MSKTKSSIGTSSLTIGTQAVPIFCSTASSNIDISDIYESIGTRDKRALEAHGRRIAEIRDKTNRNFVTAILDVGAEVYAAHELLSGLGREGRFIPWCRVQELSKSTAYRLLDTFTAFGECETVQQFDVDALYLLSADSCPEGATAEAMHLASKGEYISSKRAKEIIAHHSDKCTDGGTQLTRGNATDSKATRNRKQLTAPVDGGGAKPTMTADTPGGERLTQQADVQITSASTASSKQVVCQVADIMGDADDRAVQASSDLSTIIDVPATAVGDAVVAIDDVVIDTADVERQTAKNGLAGLETVISALRSLGMYDDYKDDIDRIQIALKEHVAESSQENEETIECIL